jgi:subfamily B ATP-binding cassette protein MsbA
MTPKRYDDEDEDSVVPPSSGSQFELPGDLDAPSKIDLNTTQEFKGLARVRQVMKPVSAEDAKTYKKLFVYVKPFLPRIIAAVIMAACAGILGSYAQLKLVQKGLDTILKGAEASERVETNADRVAELKRQLKAIEDAIASGKVSATDEATEQSSKDKLAALTQKKEALKLSEEEQAKRKAKLFEIVLMFLGIVLTSAMLGFGQTLIMASATRKIVRRIRDDCFEHLMRLPLRFHQSNHSGKLVARITKDINRLRELLVSMMITGVKESFIFIGALVFAISQTWVVAAFAVAFVVVAVVPIRIIADKIRNRDREEEAGSGDMFAVLQEALQAQKVIKTFTAEDHETAKFKAITKDINRKQLRTQRLRAWTEPLVELIGGVGIAVGFAFLGGLVLKDELEFAVLATTLFAMQRINASVRKLGKTQNDFAKGITAGERVAKILDQSPEIHEAPDARPLEQFAEAIAFNDVVFGYDPNRPVLRGITFSVKKGETVAIVGPSGAGKTSLVDLLPRLYDPSDGSITIDGTDLRDYTLKSLRERIGIVSQETMLFRDTIKQNIAYGLPDIDDHSIVEAARFANAHEFILEKAMGYDTPLGERGGRLSGGEKQRIAIARALLKNPPILILDEATSALDAEAEHRVQEALERLMKGRTTIVIAHRLATITRANRIVVMHRGQILEQGTHHELLAQNGRYAKAYNLQLEAMKRGEREKDIDTFFGDVA